MNTIVKKSALLALLVLASASAAAGGVTVKLSNTDNYFDLPFASWDRDTMLKDLEEAFTRLGKRLPENEELRIEVTDFDPAGRIRHTGRVPELRVMTGRADWPRVSLNYTHLRDGQVVASGTEALSDMNYLQRFNRYTDSDTLRYEKRMIDDWFKGRIAAR